VGEHPRCGLDEVLELQSLQRDAGLLLQAPHHGVVELPLAGEVPVDGPLRDQDEKRSVYLGCLSPFPERKSFAAGETAWRRAHGSGGVSAETQASIAQPAARKPAS
jgi:hypothetical protein